MTENEAIALLVDSYIVDFAGNTDKNRMDCEKFIVSALKELQEYRKLGTVEEVREAVRKTKPEKPDLEGDGCADGEMVYDTWYCPNCGQWYETDYDDYKHCPECGQKIDQSGLRLEGKE